MPRRLAPLAFPLGALCAALGWPSPALASDPTIQAMQEAALPPGSLPAWETQAERMRVRRPPPQPFPPTPLPLPPAPGFRVPAEFEPVSAFVVTQGDWQDTTWSNDIRMLVDMLQQGTAPEGAGAIVLTRGATTTYESYLAGKGVDMTRVQVVRAAPGLDAKWARDFGPLSLYEPAGPRHLAFVDLHYYDAREDDDAVVSQLALRLGVARFGLEGDDHVPPDPVKLYLEGGNFITDGQGTCILSDDVASDNAKENNPQADTRAEVESILAGYLDCRKLIWLAPLPNNSTGHVDMYAKLLSPTDVLMIDFPSQSGASGQADAVVEANVLAMQEATNLQGQPFTVHRVVIPSLSSSWVYRTYTNATILNRVVLVPTYGSSYDDAALQVYRDVLGPDYVVRGIDASDIIAQGGAVHCTTMQIASACGDGRAQTLLFEACDGADLLGATCLSLGLGDGVLSCTADCTFDTSACASQTESQPEAGAPDAEPDASRDAPAETGQDAAAADAGIADATRAEDGSAVDDAPDARAPAEAPSSEPAGDDGSCACRSATTPSTEPGFAASIAAVIAAWVARRRRVSLRRQDAAPESA